MATNLQLSNKKSDELSAIIAYAKDVMVRHSLHIRASEILRELARHPSKRREKALVAELVEIEIQREKL